MTVTMKNKQGEILGKIMFDSCELIIEPNILELFAINERKVHQYVGEINLNKFKLHDTEKEDFLALEQ